MLILKILFLLFALAVFVVSALIVRNDPKNENPWATILLVLSMAALIVFEW